MNHLNLVVHMTPCKPNSTIASARVARFIVNTLAEERFNLVDTRELAQTMIDMGAPLKNLIIVNGPMAFCDFLPEIAVLVKMADTVVWVQQDYTITPPSSDSKAESPFRKVFAELNLRPIYWTTVKKNVQTIADCYINWNQLTWDPQPYPELSEDPTLFYYGAYREKREKDFLKYFCTSQYEVKVSTTPIRGKKFKAVNDDIAIVPPFTSLGEIPSCRATLYIEDERSHREFHSPANRFYEMLSAGIPIFFDAKTLPMLKEADIIPRAEWVVHNATELAEGMKSKHKMGIMLRDQRVMWADNYIHALRQRLLHIWTSGGYGV